MKQKRILGWLLLSVTSTAFGQWKKVAQPYQDKMNYYSAAKAYSKVLDSGNVADFVTYTRVLFNQGKFRETYENYKLLSTKNELKEMIDLQAFRTCQSILDPSKLADFDQSYFSLFLTASVNGFEKIIPTINDEYTLQTACFNSEDYEDLSPTLVGNNIMFTSSRPSTNSDLGNYKYNDQPFYDVFITSGCDVKTMKSTLAKDLPKDINTYLHDGPAFYAEKSGLFFLTRNIERSNGTLPMGIYFSQKEAKGWSKFQALPVNNYNYTVQHPYFDDSTKTLYFSSNMAGGFGGFDLYSMKFENGTWSQPKNLGSPINTPLNEVFPYMYKRDLYFSSNGNKSAGGLDIFMANEFGLYSMNSLNSAWDDYGLLFINDSTGFMTSSRLHGFAKDDIFSFSLKTKFDPSFIKVYAKEGDKKWGEPKQASLKLVVVDSISSTPVNLTQLTITIKNKLSGLETTFTTSTDSLGVLMGYFEKDSIFDIEVLANHPDYVSKKVEFRDLITQNGVIDMGKLELSRKPNYKPQFKYPQLRPIYFDLDKFYIRKDAAKTLDSIVMVLKEYPNMRLELRSFTDSRASDNYNKKLSENRANSTFKYLIKKGINKRRLVYAGYGELGLVNDCGDDKKCEERLHQLNRRTEFRIIE